MNLFIEFLFFNRFSKFYSFMSIEQLNANLLILKVTLEQQCHKILRKKSITKKTIFSETIP